MFVNPNRKYLRRLARQIYKNRKPRNRVVITAVALTTSLFALVFTIGISLVQTLENETMRLVGTSAHGSIDNLTSDEWDKVRRHGSIRQYGTRVIVGDAENKALKKRANTQIQYEDENYARWGFHTAKKGGLPIAENEIMTDSRTLELLGIEKKLGVTVPVEFTLRGEKIRKDFVLSGFFDSDEGAAYDIGVIIVSLDFIHKNFDGYEVSDKERITPPLSGTYEVSIMLNNRWDIENKIRKIADESLGKDYPLIELHYNWAYMGGLEMDPTTSLMGIIVLLMIFSSGFLIIYNIFRISITQDIRFYGLFKTLGTTSSQLKKMVLYQALMFALRGIPAGLFCGYLLGGFLLPLIEAQMTVSRLDLSVNPLIFLGAACFSGLTLYCGIIRSCRKAAAVSPMEAVRFQAISGGRKTDRKTGQSRITSLARHYVFRFRGKTVNVTLSLALSLIVLLTITAFIGGFDSEKYVSLMTPCDFSIGDADLYDVRADQDTDYADINAVSGILREKFPLKEDEYVYYRETVFNLDDGESKDRFENVIKEKIKSGDIIQEMISYLESMADSGKMSHQIYGIGEIALKSLAIGEGSIDFDKWKSGKYLISGRYGDKIYFPGDKIRLTGEDGIIREYTVMASASSRISDSIGIGYSLGLSESLYLPAEEYRKLYGDMPIKYIFNGDNQDLEEINDFLADYTESVEPDLNFSSRLKASEEYKGIISLFTLIGGGLSAIIGLIGLMNLINTLYTGIISRRREFASLQAVGMTLRQLKRMLVTEGFYYGVISLAWVVFPGVPLVVLSSHILGNEIWFYSFHYPMRLFVLLIPVVLGFSVLLPYLVLRKSGNLSITEALRLTDF